MQLLYLANQNFPNYPYYANTGRVRTISKVYTTKTILLTSEIGKFLEVMEEAVNVYVTKDKHK
jgi:hypothetical protein